MNLIAFAVNFNKGVVLIPFNRIDSEIISICFTYNEESYLSRIDEIPHVYDEILNHGVEKADRVFFSIGLTRSLSGAFGKVLKNSDGRQQLCVAAWCKYGPLSIEQLQFLLQPFSPQTSNEEWGTLMNKRFSEINL